jgi:hypothetical protein
MITDRLECFTSAFGTIVAFYEDEVHIPIEGDFRDITEYSRASTDHGDVTFVFQIGKYM